MEWDKFSVYEKRKYQSFNRLKLRHLKPLFRFLTFLHFTPNILTLAGLLTAIVFAFTLNISPVLSIFLLLLHMALDGIDGGLAKYQKSSSDFGKFFDFINDSVSMAIVLVFLPISSNLIIAYLFSSYALDILSIVRCILKRPAYFNLHSRLIVYVFVMFYLIGVDYLYLSMLFFSLLNSFQILFGLKAVLRR